MCYNNENASWCDGTNSDYYDDDYFKTNGVVNPFGDSNSRNRKCNTVFGQQSSLCMFDWACGSGFFCGKPWGTGGECIP